MLDSQQGFGTSYGSKKNYSRKELTQWLAKQSAKYSKTAYSNSCNINSLKNGVFFLIIIQQIFPNSAASIKSKMKQKPVTEYEFQKNLELLKKVLNMQKLQMNLDINQMLKSKNCFDFLNQIKNLHDEMIPSQTNSQIINHKGEQILSPQKNFPKNQGYKTNREISPVRNIQQALSQGKSNRKYSGSKDQNPFFKIKSGKNIVQVSNKKNYLEENQRSQLNTEQKSNKLNCMSEFDSIEDCSQNLYQRALQESICSLKKILEKVKISAKSIQDGQSFEAYLNKINLSIFGRSS